MSAFARSAWPAPRLGEALELAAALAGREPAGAAELATPPAAGPDGSHPGRAVEAAFAGWLAEAAAHLGVEAEPVSCAHGETLALLSAAAPALLELPRSAGEAAQTLLLAGATRRSAILLGPDRERRRVPFEDLREALWREAEERVAGVVDGVLDRAQPTGQRRARARRALVAEQLEGAVLGPVWCVRLSASARPRTAARRARLGARVAALTGAHFAAAGLFVGAWAALGRGALQGRLEAGWLVAWALLLISLLPFRLAASRLQGGLAVDLGALLKRRLLQGALRLDPEATRHQGAGQLLGRVLESEAVETLALGSGFLALGAAVELALAAWVLSHAPAAGALLLALAFASGAVLLLALRVLRRGRAWTAARLDATHDLVERMVGHRTRLAQETPLRWHAGEDERLDAYLRRAAQLDRASLPLTALLPGTWLAVGVLLLAPDLLAGGADAVGLALGLGGVLLAQRALAKLSSSAVQLGALRIAWEAVRPLFRAAADDPPPGVPGAAAGGTSGDVPPALEARRVTFAYAGRAEPALRACDLRVRRGDRVLIEGPSGGGKSTLAALLLGLERPDGGLVLLHGLDRATWGADAWRARVAAAPQFHQNHVFSGTLAFNLLLGRGWPPATADLADAETLCAELGLGPLIARMPAGLLQAVGETGWQLSHGERSRVFLARALLQGGEIVLLDETFGALDPGAMESALDCALRRAPSLVVIAHP